MKKIVWSVVALLGVGITVHARTSAESDSLKVINLQEVQVVSTRATAKTPMAFTNIGKAELKKVNFGQDIPYLLSMTPSTLTTSDAGAGIGYTTLRVRGTDGTRINITVNGIPMNDAESHNLFWVNMPDFSSSVKDMQVQRGAGTSTNGAGAFGASVNMQTEGAAMKPYAEFNGSYGSFNTHKETVKVGTGLLNNHWTFDARLSNIGTDGYIDRASVDLNSYYLQGGYFAENTSVKLIAFAGKKRLIMLGDMQRRRKWRNSEDDIILAGKCIPTPTATNIIIRTKRTTTCKRTTNYFLTIVFLPHGI